MCQLWDILFTDGTYTQVRVDASWRGKGPHACLREAIHWKCSRIVPVVCSIVTSAVANGLGRVEVALGPSYIVTVTEDWA